MQATLSPTKEDFKKSKGNKEAKLSAYGYIHQLSAICISRKGTQRLQRQEKILSDNRGNVTLCVFEEQIEQLQINKFYQISQVKVHSWGTKKSLSTSRNTIIKTIQLFEITKVFVIELPQQLQKMQVAVQSINIRKHLKCNQCENLLECPDRDNSTGDSLIQCVCNNLQKQRSMELQFQGSAEVLNGHTKLHVTFTRNSLLELAQNIDPEQYGIDIDEPLHILPSELQTILLMEPEITIEINSDTKVVHGINIENESAEEAIQPQN